MFHQLQSRPYGLTEKVQLYNAARGLSSPFYFFIEQDIFKMKWVGYKKDENGNKCLCSFCVTSHSASKVIWRCNWKCLGSSAQTTPALFLALLTTKMMWNLVITKLIHANLLLFKYYNAPEWA